RNRYSHLGGPNVNGQPYGISISGRNARAPIMNVITSEQAGKHGGRRGCLGGAKRMRLLEDGTDQQIEPLSHLRQYDGPRLVLWAAMFQPQASGEDSGVAGRVLQYVFGFGHGGLLRETKV